MLFLSICIYWQGTMFLNLLSPLCSSRWPISHDLSLPSNRDYKTETYNRVNSWSILHKPTSNWVVNPSFLLSCHWYTWVPKSFRSMGKCSGTYPISSRRSLKWSVNSSYLSSLSISSTSSTASPSTVSSVKQFYNGNWKTDHDWYFFSTIQAMIFKQLTNYRIITMIFLSITWYMYVNQFFFSLSISFRVVNTWWLKTFIRFAEIKSVFPIWNE